MDNLRRLLIGLLLILIADFSLENGAFAESRIDRARAKVGQHIRANEYGEADELLKKLIAAGDAPSSYLRAVLMVKNRVPGNTDEIRTHLCFAAEQRYSRANTLIEKLDIQCEESNQTADETEYPSQTNIATAWLEAAPQTGYRIKSGGSGVAVNADGMFITNHHVVDGCGRPTIVYQQLRGQATVLMASEALDLALLQVKAPTPSFVRFDHTDFVLGEALYAAGYPLSSELGDDLKFSQGILMSDRDDERGRISSGFLVTNLPIGNGSSGGPVLSEEGLLRGLVSGFWVIGEAVEGSEGSRMSENLTGVVSGLAILNQLRSFDKQIPQIYSGTKRTLRSREVAKLAEKVTVKVECIAYD